MRSGTSTATLLFTDLVDSTLHRTHLGERRADEMFREVEQLKRAQVAAHSGEVLKTAGDGIMAVFDAASDAVSAAVDIQRQLLQQHPELSARVGVAAGDVSWSDGDCSGLPVVTAARLEASAQPGQILVTSVVQLMAGDRADVRYVSVGRRTLKGMPAPVDTMAVEWDATPARDLQRLPPTLASAARQPFVGRGQEHAALLERWRANGADGSTVLLVGGEAGVGKTRLVAEFARGLVDQQAVVLGGVCDRGLSLPYRPWIDALVQLTGHLGPAQRRSLDDELQALAVLGPPFDRAAPGAGAASTNGEAERARLFRAVHRLLAAASRTDRVLLVVEDLHWAGPQTIALLRHVTRVDPVPGLVVAATFRDTSDQVTEHLATFLADLRRGVGVSRVSLGGLDAADVGDLLAGTTTLTGDQLAALAAFIAERSGGNAFLATELCNAADDVIAGEVPDSVREVVERQVAGLGEHGQRIARLLAVGAAPTPVRVLSRALGGPDRRALLNAVDVLLGAGLVVELDDAEVSVQFRHSLQRDAVRSGLSSLQRANLHADLAVAYEREYESDRRSVLAELTRHFASATTVLGPDKAVYYARRAAASARRTASYEESIELLEAALAVATEAAHRAALQVELGDLLVRSGRLSEGRAAARQAYDLATEAGQLRARADGGVLLGLASVLTGHGIGDAASALDDLLRDVPTSDPRLRCRILARLGQARWLIGDTTVGHALMTEALDLARDLDDSALIGHALEALANQIDDPHRALAISDELDQITDASDDPWRSMWALGNRLRSLILLGDLPTARRALAPHIERSTRYRFRMFRYQSLVFASFFEYAAAHFNEAERLAVEADHVAADEPGLADSGVFGLQMFMIRRHQQRLDEMRPVLDILALQSEESGAWQPGLACAYAELGMATESRDVYDEIMTDTFHVRERDQIWPITLSFLADTCLLLEDHDTAQLLLDELAAYRGWVLTAGFTTAAGPADRFRAELAALLGRADEAQDALTAAATIVDRSESPIWQSDLERARDRVERWIEDAPRLATDPNRWPGGLSDREIEVLGLVAVGCSNRSIAERLHISTNTVANHVRSIRQKTGSANRTEAAAYAHRHGLPIADVPERTTEPGNTP